MVGRDTYGTLVILTALALACAAERVHAQELVKAKDGSGVIGYKHTPIQPWSGLHVHDPDCPVPPKVQVGPAPDPSPAPSDAVVLFDGKNLSAFEPTSWKIVDGAIEATSGDLRSKQQFGDCQVHVEWMTPRDFESPWYNRGNSGVNLMGRYEIQIFDSFNEKIYPDGQAGSVYGQTPPLVNACRPPGEWQSYDIVFFAPVFEGEKLVEPARVTVFHNGVLVQHDTEIHGEVRHAALPAYTQTAPTGPLMLGGHDCPVRFRNIWVRPL